MHASTLRPPRGARQGPRTQSRQGQRSQTRVGPAGLPAGPGSATRLVDAGCGVTTLAVGGSPRGRRSCRPSRLERSAIFLADPGADDRGDDRRRSAAARPCTRRPSGRGFSLARSATVVHEAARRTKRGDASVADGVLRGGDEIGHVGWPPGKSVDERWGQSTFGQGVRREAQDSTSTGARGPNFAWDLWAFSGPGPRATARSPRPASGRRSSRRSARGGSSPSCW